jgi:flavin-dependent amine oxidoreductase
VLAIPVGALSASCGPLMKRDPKLREAVKCSATVRTQAFQLWTTRSQSKLGFRHPAHSVAATFVEPLDTYCDMTHLLGKEDWTPGDDIQGVAYVCGVLDDRDETAEQATERVRQNALEYLRNDVKHLWKGAGADPFSALADPLGRTGEERFCAQYWRANIAPWERYVITPSGTVAKRMPSNGSCFANLVAAGDWTANGLNGGCVEAAVISGLQAARSLTGGSDSIVGETPTWLTPA